MLPDLAALKTEGERVSRPSVGFVVSALLGSDSTTLLAGDSTTRYVCVSLAEFPSESLAVTVQVCTPRLEVSIGLPLGTGPSQDATAESASEHE